MEYIISAAFGVVQGLTEFIPVSSSGHLLLMHQFLPPLALSDELGFDVALHVGTLIALCLVFWSDIVRFAKAAINKNNPDFRTAWLIALAMIPAGIAGILFEDIIETVLRSPYVVVVMLALVGVVFLVVERVMAGKLNTTVETLTWKHALFIGCMQVLALIPGTSRSGITIVSGMMAGVQRHEAARFSFLVSIPLIAGAGLKKGLDLVSIGVPANEWPLIVTGLIVSAIVGYMAIRFLLKYLEQKGLAVFGWYRIALAIVVLVALINLNV